MFFWWPLLMRLRLVSAKNLRRSSNWLNWLPYVGR